LVYMCGCVGGWAGGDGVVLGACFICVHVCVCMCPSSVHEIRLSHSPSSLSSPLKQHLTSHHITSHHITSHPHRSRRRLASRRATWSATKKSSRAASGTRSVSGCWMWGWTGLSPSPSPSPSLDVSVCLSLSLSDPVCLSLFLSTPLSSFCTPSLCLVCRVYLSVCLCGPTNSTRHTGHLRPRPVLAGHPQAGRGALRNLTDDCVPCMGWGLGVGRGRHVMEIYMHAPPCLPNPTLCPSYLFSPHHRRPPSSTSTGTWPSSSTR
jgi:hypothetical protein